LEEAVDLSYDRLLMMILTISIRLLLIYIALQVYSLRRVFP
jgi:hypothetical protein